MALEVNRMLRACLRVGLGAFLIAPLCCYGQGHPSREASLERMIVVVPMVGAGTAEDPRRPMGMPAGDAKQESPVGYRYVVSDSGRLAIVAITAPSRKHLDSVLTGYGALAEAFNPLNHERATVEKALKLIRRDFDLDSFLGVIRLPGGAK